MTLLKQPSERRSDVSLMSKTVNQIDHPEEFDKLPDDQQEIVIKWIKENILPRKTINHIHTSYGLKHIFEADQVGFYMTNGEFKGAMIACGHEPVKMDDLNCNYRISQKSLAFNYYKR